MERLVIGLMGLKQSGKSTVAQILAEDGFTILEPGQQVMELLLDINPYMYQYMRTKEVYDIMGYEGFKRYPEGRRLLQELGTRIRERDEDFWVRQQYEVIMTHEDVVSTAVRFPNEALMIRRLGGVVIEVTSPRSVDDDLHASETAWRSTKPDYQIVNDGTLSDLRVTVRRLIGELR